MIRNGLALLLLLAACDSKAPVAPSVDNSAMTAAERQAVGDTDAAMAEARAVPAPGTNEADARFPR